MIFWFLIGAAALFVFMGGLRAFEKAKVRSIKSLFAWILALGGLSLALLLIVTGRGGIALSALLLFGPLLWQQFKAGQGPGPQPNPFARQPPRAASGNMTAVEAYQILGLKPGATDAEIKDAHRRLMMAAHPDHGGSDWLATRINQARDVLLG